jgi:hypothetical protein
VALAQGELTLLVVVLLVNEGREGVPIAGVTVKSVNAVPQSFDTVQRTEPLVEEALAVMLTVPCPAVMVQQAGTLQVYVALLTELTA